MGLRFQHQCVGSLCRVAVLAAWPYSDRLDGGALWLIGWATGLGLLKGTQRLGPFAIGHVRQSPFLRPRSISGSATQVMLTTRFRATVGQKLIIPLCWCCTPKPGNID